jgi:GNAT superfamily N-acetyltransferase
MPENTIRPARSEDRDAVFAFCQQTWEWGDYIERIWDEWLDDPQGQLFVATSVNSHEQPIGIMHLHMVSENDAWAQGLRVDPNYRRQGIARALHETVTIEAMRRGASYLRLTIETDNLPSINLVEQLHMRPIGSYRLYTAPPLPAQKALPRQRPQLATIEELDEIIEYLNTSSIFPLVGGVYYAKWRAQPITAEWLEERIQAQQVYMLRRWEQIDGLAIAEMRQENGEQTLSVGYIDGTTIEAISFIAYDLRRRLHEMELDRVHIYAPDMVLAQDAFDGAEYEAGSPIYNTYERGLF